MHTHVGLGGRQAELDKGDLGLVDAVHTTGSVRGALVKEDAINELRLVHCAPGLGQKGVENQKTTTPQTERKHSSLELLDHADVPQVDIAGAGRQDAQDRVHDDGAQRGRVLRDNLFAPVRNRRKKTNTKESPSKATKGEVKDGPKHTPWSSRRLWRS